ncbi:MAG: PilZ domain-containing protein, partial [Planctomycetota bacterium]
MSFRDFEFVERRDRRYEIDQNGIRILVHRPDGQQQEPLEALPLDISANGIKLRTDLMTNIKGPVQLEFFSENDADSFCITADVCWRKVHTSR